MEEAHEPGRPWLDSDGLDTAEKDCEDDLVEKCKQINVSIVRQI